MNLKELFFRIRLLPTWLYLRYQRYTKAYAKASKLITKRPNDIRAIILFADACFYTHNLYWAKAEYDRAKLVLREDTKLSEQNLIFLIRFLSLRRLEVDYLNGEEVGVAKAHVVEELNNKLPANKHLKTMFFLDKDSSTIPRPYGRRTSYKQAHP